MGRKRNRRELLEARATGEPVQFPRTLENADRMDGFVLDVGTDRVLLHRSQGLKLDGWSAVRLDTIHAVERCNSADVMARALQIHHEAPKFIAIDLAGPTPVIRSMARVAPPITLHREAKWPDECYIGRLTSYTAKRVELLEIDPQAHWLSRPRPFGLRKLTRIEIAARPAQLTMQYDHDSPRGV